jgi:hypothetical protein
MSGASLDNKDAHSHKQKIKNGKKKTKYNLFHHHRMIPIIFDRREYNFLASASSSFFIII